MEFRFSFMIKRNAETTAIEMPFVVCRLIEVPCFKLMT